MLVYGGGGRMVVTMACVGYDVKFMLVYGYVEFMLVYGGSGRMVVTMACVGYGDAKFMLVYGGDYGMWWL